MGFKRSWVRIPPARYNQFLADVSTFTFCAAARPAAAHADHVEDLDERFGAIISVIPKLRVTVSRGLLNQQWNLSSHRADAIEKENVIFKTGRGRVMNSIGYGRSAVAAATGRGFKSRRPERFLATDLTQIVRGTKKSSV